MGHRAAWPPRSTDSVLAQVLESGGFDGVAFFPRTEKLSAMLVVGDSMLGAGIENGDIVVLADRQPASGAVVVAVLAGGRTLKRYLVEEGQHLLRAANASFPDIPLQGAPKTLGTVVGVVRDFSLRTRLAQQTSPAGPAKVGLLA